MRTHRQLSWRQMKKATRPSRMRWRMAQMPRLWSVA